jgi:hypothetical protein
MVGGDLESRVIDKRKTPNQSANSWSATYDTATLDVAGLRARLTAISGTLYPATYLNLISVNDMRYAVRMSDDAASF